MISNLFSIFDPSVSLNLSLNWLSLLIFCFLVPYSFWVIPSRFMMFFNLILSYFFGELKLLLVKESQFNLLFFLSLLFFIVFNNFMGLFFYIFTSSSHMCFSFSFSILLWISMMLFGWINYSEHMFSHLVPLGTPKALMVFMVLIETISNVIRPGTLAIRLSANMIAGHLLLSLIGSTCSSVNIFILNIILVLQIFLFILEMAVSLIQSYVFCVLNILYSGEVN